MCWYFFNHILYLILSEWFSVGKQVPDLRSMPLKYFTIVIYMFGFMNVHTAYTVKWDNQNLNGILNNNAIGVTRLP